MSERVDARGLSCPQPVVVTLNRINQIRTGTIEVLVDSPTARDNILRMASGRGWQAEVKEQEGEFLLILTKA